MPPKTNIVWTNDAKFNLLLAVVVRGSIAISRSEFDVVAEMIGTGHNGNACYQQFNRLKAEASFSLAQASTGNSAAAATPKPVRKRTLKALKETSADEEDGATPTPKPKKKARSTAASLKRGGAKVAGKGKGLSAGTGGPTNHAVKTESDEADEAAVKDEIDLEDENV